MDGSASLCCGPKALEGFPGGSAMQETQVRSLDGEDPLEKGMATHSSILAWRIPWTEEPGGLQPRAHRDSDTTWQPNNDKALENVSPEQVRGTHSQITNDCIKRVPRLGCRAIQGTAAAQVRMSVSSLSRRHGGREENVLQSIETAISRKTTRETSRSQNRDFSSCLTPSCRWHVAATGGDWTEPGLLRC